ncbi:MAG: UDP-glucose--hexose-1-phosphate uridylyltransferase [Clostridia bacterium]|nr:UDP-glucose--hexose-1-phosphate uridylyltransferase [Clostridia bacterium]
MINESIRKLICYGLSKGLFDKRDEIFVTNSLLECLGVDDYSCDKDFCDVDLESTLKEILDYAVKKGLINDTVTERDLFDTKVMSRLLPRPSEVTDKFYELYKVSPKDATDYYYKLSCDSDYIRRYRIKKDLKWQTDTKYGTLDITVNLSKPEKDPKAIAAAKNAAQVGYPKCLLCKECEGYAGRINFPARQNHRLIPVKINGSDWFLQYSPYVYYNEHCIVFNGEHSPMAINADTFKKLTDFISQFPHYFVGSNADLPIVGGSILSHDHFQGGNYTFAMAKAPIETDIKFNGYEDIAAGIVKWPMSVIRLTAKDKDRLCELANKILLTWRDYTDETVGIFAYTDNTPHNTITPIARRCGVDYQLDLVLRNNITTKEHPLGVFHPHSELHHIKKENIGLIEVMGLAVLPSRLKDEMVLLKDALLNGKDISKIESIEKHADWANMIKEKYPSINKDNIDKIINDEIGLVFETVLCHAGVFKRDEEGHTAFIKFTESVK